MQLPAPEIALWGGSSRNRDLGPLIIWVPQLQQRRSQNGQRTEFTRFWWLVLAGVGEKSPMHGHRVKKFPQASRLDTVSFLCGKEPGSKSPTHSDFVSFRWPSLYSSVLLQVGSASLPPGSTSHQDIQARLQKLKMLILPEKVKNGNNPNSAYKTGLSSVQFSRSVMSDSLWPHESQYARPPCSSPSPGVHSDSHPSSPWCHPAISSSVVPFSSCPESLPASGSFPMSQLFAWGGQSTGVSALASFLLKKSQGWSPSEWTGWILLQSKGLSRVFSNTTVQKHQFFSAQLSSQSNSHIHIWLLEKP